LDNNQAIIIFALLTSPSQGPLPKETLAFLDKLMPHVSRVCRLSIQNFIYSTQALVGHTLVNKLRQPVILASVTGEVVHVNEAAKDLLNATSLISVADNLLRLPAKYGATLFDDCAAMEYALKGSEASPEATKFKLLQIKSADETETLYTFYALLLPQRMMGAFGLRPLVMMFFYHPESAPQIDASILNAAFGLTPSECRIAMLVAEGLSQKDIAEKLSLKHDTVRKQLQIIYQKTSTSQQTELVRLMLNVPSNFVQKPPKQIE
jgi:DNA-binding CsgD family transcriptional regulator